MTALSIGSQAAHSPLTLCDKLLVGLGVFQHTSAPKKRINYSTSQRPVVITLR